MRQLQLKSGVIFGLLLALFSCSKDISRAKSPEQISSDLVAPVRGESQVTQAAKAKPSDAVISPSSSPQATKVNSRLKLVWMSLDGFQPVALDAWVSKIPSPHPKGLKWLLKKARGKNDLKVINPTITAPSHISTLTCTPAGVHGIMDNSTWTGTETVSGFGKAYEPENWISRLRREGLRVGVALYPSIDGSGPGRSADVGISYDTAGSSTQMINVSNNGSVDVIIPSRSTPGKSHTIRLTADSKGVVTGSTPWGPVPALEVAKPYDVVFKTQIKSTERTVGVSIMLVLAGDKNLVAVSPVQVMPTFSEDLAAWIDGQRLIFSSLKDYKMQSNVPAYLAAMSHRHADITEVDLALLARTDLDAVFLYFPDLDSLLHGFYKDAANEKHVVEYLSSFDREIAKIVEAIPHSADFLVVGDHGMSAIGYSLNARKILTEDVAAKGLITASGGAMYFYPPAGEIKAAPPSDLDLNQIAQRLRNMEFEVTKKKIFAKVLVRGSKEAAKEGLGGDQVPWIMGFANDGIGFKNSVEDRLLLARAPWATIPEELKPKYADVVNHGVIERPVPAGQHGHYNGLPQMRTRLILEGPRLSKIKLSNIDKTLQLVPAIADAEGWPRPDGCK